MTRSIQNEINKAFQVLSHEIIPSDEYLENGNTAADTIFQLIQQKIKFDVARQYISGSSGKNTSIFNSDLDLVLFINKIDLSDIEDVLDDFEDILTLKELPKLNSASLKTTRFSIQFEYDGFQMDVLPAINFVNHRPQQPSNPQLAAQQASAVLRKIKEDPSKSYHYSSALAESQLEFMKRQSSFIHELVRICKLWNKSLLIDGYISGRSTLIELIAVHAGQREENNRASEDTSLLSAFQTFLRLIEDFPRLRIEFDFDPLKPYETMNQLMRGSQFDPQLKRSFYVIEPANPFNNIAKGVDDRQMKLFQSFAKETLGRLRKYVTAKHFNVRIPLDDIFQPQPKVIPYINENQRKLFQTASFLLGTNIEESPRQPSMVIRNDAKYKSRDMQVVLKHLQTVFTVVAQGFVSSVPYNSSKTMEQIRDELKKRAQLCVDVNVKEGEPREWSPSQLKHEDHEVTLRIPCHTQLREQQVNYCVVVSLKST